jgi:hypothetical protein
MQLFRITLEQTAGFLTEPTSGILMGQLAWAYRYLYGSTALEDLLTAYRQADANGSAPPLICSAALPAGMAPRPAFETLLPAERRALAHRCYQSQEAGALLQLDQAIGKVRNQPWLPHAALAALINDLTPAALFAALLALPQTEPALAPARLEQKTRTHTAINRLTNGALAGQLFDSDELLFQPNRQLEIWVRITPAYATDAWLAQWQQCVTVLAQQGIGARTSTGRGAVRLVAGLTPVPATALPGAAHPNAFLSLAAWAPRPTDPDAIAYHLETRHGKLGGLYGSSDHVWKYPVTTLRPGAIGRLPAGATLQPVYGRLIEGVHRTRPEIVDFGYAFPIGVRVTG